MSTAEIAVVIPTRARETRLRFALEALAAQTLSRERFEVVVVRDGDAGGPLASAPNGLSVRFETCPGVAGPAIKRNLGWRRTAAPLVAFTDDDCRPDPEWLERLLAAAEGDDVFLQGRTVPDPDELHLLYGLARTQRIEGRTEFFEACNIAYPRALLERLGGFDEEFFFGGEDTDLGLRAREAGARAVFVEGAAVRHAVLTMRLRVALSEAARWPSVARVVARHPEHRRALFGRYFWRRSHAALLLAAAGGIFARRNLPLAGAAVVPYVWLYAGLTRPTPKQLVRDGVQVLAHAAVDAVEVAATVRAAVRHRVLLI